MNEHEVVIKMVTDMQDLRKGLQETQTKLEKIESSLGKVKSTSAFSAVAHGLQLIEKYGKIALQVITDLVKAYEQAETEWTTWNVQMSKSKFSQKEIDRLKEYTAELQQLTGIGDEAIANTERLFLTVQDFTEEGLERAVMASADLAGALGGDIVSSAQTLAIALEDPEAGMERLRRSGVLFTAEEKQLITALTEAGDKLGAQDVILKKVEERYGGIAKAIGETNTGTLKKIRETWGDIKENMGQGIINAIEPALNMLLRTLNKISDWTAQYNDNVDVAEEREQLKQNWATGKADLGRYSTKAITEEYNAQRDLYQTALAEAMGNYDSEIYKARKESWETYGKALQAELIKRAVQSNAPAIGAPVSATGTGGTDTEQEKSLFMQTWQTYQDAIDEADKALQEFRKHYDASLKDEMQDNQLAFYEKNLKDAKDAMAEWIDSLTEEVPPAVEVLNEYQSQLKDFDEKIAYYTAELGKATTEGEKNYWNKMIKDAKAGKKALQEFGMQQVPEVLNEYQQTIKDLDEAIKVYQQYADNAESEAEKAYWDERIAQFTEAREALLHYGEAVDDWVESREDAITRISEIIKNARALLNGDDGTMPKQTSYMQAGIDAMLSGVETLGEALAGNADAWGDWANSVLRSIADVVASHAYQMIAEGTAKLFDELTMAEGLKEIAKGAGVLALSGTIRGLARFERGGIVGGSGITGDTHIIRANAGELILTKAQQNNLANQLAGRRATTSINVEFNGTVLGDQQSVSAWVYDGIERAKYNGII